MKRSPPPPPPASSSSSSSSSSSYLKKGPPPPPAVAEDNQLSQPEKVRPKRTRRNRTATDLKLAVSSPPGSNNKRSSIYRGVTRHRWTGRFEAHLWDKGSWNNIQKKKGRQVYLGAYDSEEAAAHTYDLAALKYWGPKTILNFPIETYTKELKEMQKVSKEEFLASLRRQSSGFSRGVSKYRGVARHHHNGRWEARIGRVYGNKYLYLGTYNTQEEAAEAYDMAAIEYRGANAVTNFDISNYIDRLKQRGISLDGVLQEPTPNSSTVSEEAEPEVEQPRQKQQDDQEQEKAATQQDLPPCLEANSTVIPMDPIGEHELNWNFCMETAGMPQLPVLEFTLQNACDQLPDLFDDTGFDELADFIFDTGSFEKKELNMEYLFDNNIAGHGAEEIVIPENMGEEEEEEKKEKDMVLSSSSSFSSTPCNNAASSGSPSSSSTTTSVSCNYSA